MSCDNNIYGLDLSFHRGHSSSSEMFSNDEIQDLLVFSDPFSINSLDPFSLSFFSFSPSKTHLETQSLYHQCNHEQQLPQPNSPNYYLESGEFTNFSALDGSEVKSEECQIVNVVDNTYNNNNYQHYNVPQSHSSGAESASEVNVMQRSSSCNSFDGNSGFPYEAHSDTLIMDSPNFQWHVLNSPENSFFTRQLRRVFSAGDLQNTKGTHRFQSEGMLLEEANFKVGRYSPEERKEKISKYRAKRSQRKFNKTIKYACRKTLADNRARIRGRFARNDDTCVIPKAPSSIGEQNEDEFWIDLIQGLNKQ